MRKLLLAASLLLAACCLGRRGDAGDRAPNLENKLAWGGVERTYRLHLPRGRDKTKPAPLVIALHGGSGTAEGMERLTRHGLDDLADRDGWLVVYPEGIAKSWNDGRKNDHSEPYKKNVDDVGFIARLIDELARRENVDPRRVYVTGISNGGFMAHRLARELSSKIAAIAPVAANLQVAADVATVPSRAVSVLAINGTKDPLVPWAGGEVHFLWQDRGRCRSVRETIDWWSKVDGCEGDVAVTQATGFRREIHGGGRDGSEVVLLAIEGGGHTWPGGVAYAPEALIGKTSRDLDANEAIWRFFARHAIP